MFKLDLGSSANFQELVPGGTRTSSNLKDFYSGTLVKPSTSNDWTAADPAGLHGTAVAGQPYLGAIGSGDQGQSTQWGSIYPEAPLAVQPASSADDEKFMGITLKPTLAYDENGEKLLYYSVKKDELQCSIPGETVPVVGKGYFTLTADSGLAAGDAPGHVLSVGASGKFEAAASNRGSSAKATIGVILASGSREKKTGSGGSILDDTWFVMLNPTGL